MSLLRQIQDSAIDSKVNVPSLLRMCKILAARLGNDDFKQWLDNELSGYPSIEGLPEYRVLSVNSKGHFSGLYGSGLRNADIPLRCVPKELREKLGHAYMLQAAAAMESLIIGKSPSLCEPWNPDLVAHVAGDIYENMICMQAWKVIPSGSVVAALDSIRTRVLNFVLEIEAQNPAAGEAVVGAKPVPQETVQQIFHTYINGNVQNLASGSANVEQHASYAEGVDTETFAKLLDAVKTAGIAPNIQSAIAAVVEEMRSTRGTVGFSARYQKFMGLLADHMQVLGPVVAPFLPALAAMLT